MFTLVAATTALVGTKLVKMIIPGATVAWRYVVSKMPEARSYIVPVTERSVSEIVCPAK
jgi:hypothetical protein